jgi:N-acetylmuramoyl-L-alanine amidase
MINIVISPSQQNYNKCIVGDTESDHMHLIGQALYDILCKYSELNVILIPKFNGEDIENLRKAVDMSNDFINKNGGEGFHLELHSDAGAYASGATGIYYSEAGKAFVIPIAKAIMELTPWQDVGLACRKDLYALKATVAIAGLIEVSFHDNSKEAQWIHDNIRVIASTLAKGILKALDIKRKIGIDEAIQLLESKGIINSPAYWKYRLSIDSDEINVNREHLKQLICNMASNY